MTVEDNDEILYTNIYKQYISNFKKIKLKNDKDEVVARLKRRSSYWKRWKTLLPSNFAPNHLFWKNIPDQSNNLLQTIARELDSWKCPYRMSRGGVGGEHPLAPGYFHSVVTLYRSQKNFRVVSVIWLKGQIISQESQKLQFSPTFKLLKKWRANSSATLSCQNVYKSKTFPFTFGARALIFELIFLPPEDFKNKHVRGSKTKRNNNSTSSLRTADAFPVVASLPQLRK